MTRAELVEIARAALADESLKRALYATLSTEFVIAACEAIVEFADHTCVEVKQETGEVEDLHKDVIQLSREMKERLSALNRVVSADSARIHDRLNALEADSEKTVAIIKLIMNSLSKTQ